MFLEQISIERELSHFILKGVRDDGLKSGAEVYQQDPHISPWSVQMLQDEVQSHVDCIIHRPVCSVGKLQGVQGCPSDKPKPVFQMMSWPQTLEQQVCSY